MEKIRMRDPGWKKFGSGMFIPDPHHCLLRKESFFYIITCTNCDRYAMFMALVSHGQGEGAQAALDLYGERVGEDAFLDKLCSNNVTYMQRYAPPI
jgi:hypothetical protein